MKKIILVVIPVWDAAPFASPGCELSLTLELRRGLVGRKRRLAGLLSGLGLFGGRRWRGGLGGLRGGLLGWWRRGGLGGFPGSLAGLGDRRLPWGWGRAA